MEAFLGMQCPKYGLLFLLNLLLQEVMTILKTPNSQWFLSGFRKKIKPESSQIFLNVISQDSIQLHEFYHHITSNWGTKMVCLQIPVQLWCVAGHL